jgi:rare lipoprotein A (peptidoglycan hydrolase)
LDTPTYANGQHCGQKVAITNLKTGQTVDVLVADECPTCDNSQSIDLSTGAFAALGGVASDGTFPIAWKFV